MRSGQVFCNLEKYLCANFQVKWSENEGGVAILRLFLPKRTKIQCFDQDFEKNIIKTATPPPFFDHCT